MDVAAAALLPVLPAAVVAVVVVRHVPLQRGRVGRRRRHDDDSCKREAIEGEMDEVIIQRITATEKGRAGGMDHLIQVIARDLIQGSPNN